MGRLILTINNYSQYYRTKEDSCFDSIKEFLLLEISLLPFIPSSSARCVHDRKDEVALRGVGNSSVETRRAVDFRGGADRKSVV